MSNCTQSRASPVSLRPELRVALQIVWLVGLIVALDLDDPRRQFISFLLSYAASIAAWIALSRLHWRAPIGRTSLAFMIFAPAALRVWAISLAPAFSDDVFRCLYEGRLGQHFGLLFPFQHAPMDAENAGVPTEFMDSIWRRINHAEIPAIYPLLSQAVFALASGIASAFYFDPLIVLKTTLAIAESVGALCSYLAFRRKASVTIAALFVWTCPIAILEVAREGHIEGLVICGTSIGVLAANHRRALLTTLAWSIAGLSKLGAFVVLPLLLLHQRGRGLALSVLTVALAATPYIMNGFDGALGLFTYASSWRSGDGAFSLLLWLGELVLGGSWRSLGSIVVESQALARIASAVAWAGCAWWLVVKPFRGRSTDPRAFLEAATGLVLLMLLFSPTLHPWYVLWLVPLAPFGGRFAVPAIAMAATSPLLHHASWQALLTGEWHDALWIRAIVHGCTWGILLYAILRESREPQAALSANFDLRR